MEYITQKIKLYWANCILPFEGGFIRQHHIILFLIIISLFSKSAEYLYNYIYFSDGNEADNGSNTGGGSNNQPSGDNNGNNNTNSNGDVFGSSSSSDSDDNIGENRECTCCENDQSSAGSCTCSNNCDPSVMNHYEDGNDVLPCCVCGKDEYNYGCTDCACGYCSSCYENRDQ